MKPSLSFPSRLLGLTLGLGLAPLLCAGITGQWDFNNPANGLAATIGQPLEYFDGPGGQTKSQTQFGTTSSFGIPDIDGAVANVMHFPVNLPTMGYIMRHGIGENGGGFYVNQWTLIMDVLFPAASSGEWRALLQADVFNAPDPDHGDTSLDAEFYLNESDGLGINGVYHGNVPPNTWVRLALAVDLAANPPVIAKYINGVKVGEQPGALTLDGRFSLWPTEAAPYDYALLFTDGYADGVYTQPGYLNSLQVHDRRVSDGYIAALGGPTANGISTQVQESLYLTAVTPPPGATGLPPAVTFEAVITNSTATLDPDSVRLTLDGEAVVPVITAGANETTVSYVVPGLLPPDSTHRFVLTYSDSAEPPTTLNNQLGFSVINYTNILLPAPLYFEDFDALNEGQLPSGWVATHFTDVSGSSRDLDFGNLDSAAYDTWTVVAASRFTGSFVTYSDPNSPQGWMDDYQRVLSVNPANVVNGVWIQNLAQGNFLFGNSGYRNGSSQVLFLQTADFDLSGKSNIHLAFHSLYEQNQDSFGSVEYSVDQGQTWLPIVYLLHGPDIIRTAGGDIDAAATLSTEHNDAATWSDPPGVARGGNYGDLIGVTPDLWSTLAPYISARLDDNPSESKRVEIFRLPEADNQAQVRFRFAYCGTDSWYFGVDSFGLYSISTVSEPARIESVRLTDGSLVLNWSGGNPPFQVQRKASLADLEWQNAGSTTDDRTFTEPATGSAAFYRVVGQ
jgi:hypothetical protein